jgi:exosortase
VGVAALLGLAWLLLALATWLWTPWLAGVAALTALTGVGWWRGGLPLLRALTPAQVLLLAIVPPPLGLDGDLTLQLRTMAVNCSAYLLDLLGVVLATSGNIIELPRQKLLVAEACSGINSVLFAGTVCLFYNLWQRRGAGRILVCLGLTLAFVVTGNALRITLGAWLLTKTSFNLLAGWPHELLGVLLTLTYVGLILSLDTAWTFLAEPIPEAPDEIVVPPAIELPAAVVRPPPRWGLAFAGAFGLLGAMGIAMAWQQAPTAAALSLAAPSALRAGTSFSLPEDLAGWQRLDGETAVANRIETAGISSHLWHYQKGALNATVALDYPFRGIHDVSICYRGAGWTIEACESNGGTGSNSPVFVAISMKKGSLEQGCLLHATVNERGNWLDVAGASDSRLESRFAGLDHAADATYRVQTLLAGYLAIAPVTERQVRDLFNAARPLLAKQITSQLQPH